MGLMYILCCSVTIILRIRKECHVNPHCGCCCNILSIPHSLSGVLLHISTVKAGKTDG